VHLWSGAQPVAYDGETGAASSSFAFGKRPPLTVYCHRTS
jgi:undecaprenyl-diphosphatase